MTLCATLIALRSCSHFFSFSSRAVSCSSDDCGGSEMDPSVLSLSRLTLILACSFRDYYTNRGSCGRRGGGQARLNTRHRARERAAARRRGRGRERIERDLHVEVAQKDTVEIHGSVSGTKRVRALYRSARASARASATATASRREREKSHDRRHITERFPPPEDREGRRARGRER